MWSQDDKIGQVLGKKFPFYRKGYTRMTGTHYYANHCPHCGAVQGDWFVVDWIAFEQQVNGKSPAQSLEVEA